MDEVWAVLGLAPTSDEGDIRRAYAVRLKQTRPEKDPEGFRRLRAAYEQAMRWAARGPAPVTTPRSAAAEPVQRAADPLDPFIAVGDVAAAAAWLAAGRADGTLSLTEGMWHADRLGWTLAHDRRILPAVVGAAAMRLGWPDNAGPAPWARALRARLEAEAWLQALRREARWPSALLTSGGRAARRLLGRGNPGRHGLWRTPALRQRYALYMLHAPVVGDAFDPARVRGINDRLSRKPSGPELAAIVATSLALVGAALGLLGGWALPAVTGGFGLACGLLAKYGQRIDGGRGSVARRTAWLVLLATGAAAVGITAVLVSHTPTVVEQEVCWSFFAIALVVLGWLCWR